MILRLGVGGWWQRVAGSPQSLLSGCLLSTEWLSAPAGIVQIAELPLRTTSLGIPWSTT